MVSEWVCEWAPILQPQQLDILPCTLVPRGECPAPESQKPSPFLSLSRPLPELSDHSGRPPTWTFTGYSMHFCPTPAPPTWLDARVLASLQILYSIWTLANNHFIYMFLSSASHSNLWSLSNEFTSSKSIPRLTNWCLAPCLGYLT